VPRAYVRDSSVRTLPLDALQIHKNQKYLINVGSVGQPRDADWRASYCLYDTDRNEVLLRRIPYDLSAAQEAILAAGLPEKLASRLAQGR
jgi:diadenosine tetraphosphatase ApaH/serine/threonine PP2A family protein phosphatase